MGTNILRPSGSGWLWFPNATRETRYFQMLSCKISHHVEKKKKKNQRAKFVIKNPNKEAFLSVHHCTSTPSLFFLSDPNREILFGPFRKCHMDRGLFMRYGRWHLSHETPLKRGIHFPVFWTSIYDSAWSSFVHRRERKKQRERYYGGDRGKQGMVFIIIRCRGRSNVRTSQDSYSEGRCKRWFHSRGPRGCSDPLALHRSLPSVHDEWPERWTWPTSVGDQPGMLF